MRYLIIILLIQPFIAAGQQPDFGEIKTNEHFDCINDSWNDSLFYGVGKICNSKNYFELRLNSSYMPHGGGELIVLLWNDDKWDIKKYSWRNGSLGREIQTNTCISTGNETWG